MKLYAEYVKEREGFDTYTYEDIGFVTYRLVGEFVEIGDVYIIPEKRSRGDAVKMMDEVAKIGKEKGCKYMAAKNHVDTNNSSISLRNTLAYGFKVTQANNNVIFLMKEI